MEQYAMITGRMNELQLFKLPRSATTTGKFIAKHYEEKKILIRHQTKKQKARKEMPQIAELIR